MSFSTPLCSYTDAMFLCWSFRSLSLSLSLSLVLSLSPPLSLVTPLNTLDVDSSLNCHDLSMSLNRSDLICRNTVTLLFSSVGSVPLSAWYRAWALVLGGISASLPSTPPVCVRSAVLVWRRRFASGFRPLDAGLRVVRPFWMQGPKQVPKLLACLAGVDDGLVASAVARL